MKEFFKKIIAAMMVIILFNSFVFASPRDNTPQVDETKKIYDFADLFSDSEEVVLYQAASEYINANNMDMAIVTIDKNNKNSSMEYADDFYDYNNFGKGSTYDGILFLIDMDNRELQISTSGEAQRLYDDYRIEKILDKTYDKISSQDYFGCASAFIERSSYYSKLGIPDSNKNTYIDKDGNYVAGSRDKMGDLFEVWMSSLVMSFIITIIFMVVSLSKHKLVKKQTHAKDYLRSINVTKRQDAFLTTHTSKVYVSTSSSSSGGSGGSSTHRSSSGRSHGGGGRRF